MILFLICMMYASGPPPATQSGFLLAKLLWLGIEGSHMEPNWEAMKDVSSERLVFALEIASLMLQCEPRNCLGAVILIIISLYI